MAFLGNFNIIAAIADGELNVNKLSAEIILSGSVSGFTNISYTEGFPDFTVYGGSVISQVNLDATLWAHVAVTVPEYKTLKDDDIDERTTELIFEGYTFGGKTFSASVRAQENLHELYAIRNEPPLITYPIRMNTIDNTDFYDIFTPAEVATIFGLYQSIKRSHIDSGTALKDAVRAATTKAEVDLVIDIR